MNPGARQHGIAGSLTGNLDFTESFYVNPGTTGLLREWQWSLSYTNWISDLYNASFLYGRNIRTPWSRFARFVVGVDYLGIPNFDSSEGASPMVSGNDLLIITSLGQPLGVFDNNLSLGANVKYFRSKLADFDADALIFDVGVLYRTPRFDFISPGSGFLDSAIFSAGISFTNIGSSITFLDEATPLPRTLRGGIAFITGNHDGVQMSVAVDYNKGRDQDGFFSLGSEISWQQLISLRWGYSFEENILGQFTFGASFNLDDQRTPLGNTLPGKNNSLRFDLALNQSSDFSSSPFHGSLTHYPIAPEGFRLIEPVTGADVDGDSVLLAWELSREPDLFDKLNYWVLVDRDSANLVQVLKNISISQSLIDLERNESLFVNQSLRETSYKLTDLSAGNYYWSVFAYDLDQHVKFSEIGKERVACFRVSGPQLQITAIDFDYSEWITQDDHQGTLKATVTNNGLRPVKDIRIAIYDSIDVQFTDKGIGSKAVTSNLIHEELLSEILPQQSKVIQTEWQTLFSGLHHIKAELVHINSRTSQNTIIHQFGAPFYTIPKGSFATGDTATVLTFLNITYEMPLVGLVFFDSSATEVKSKFIRDWAIEPPLITLSRRLNANPELKVALQGTADPNSGETDVTLADARALAVRDSLLNLGVSLAQLELKPGQVLPVRSLPRDRQDALWILQERRRVNITTDPSIEDIVFAPFDQLYNDKSEQAVSFDANIMSPLTVLRAEILLQADDFVDTTRIQQQFDRGELQKDIQWLPAFASLANEDQALRKPMTYSLVVTDSLRRVFKTEPQETFLNTQIINRERMYFGIAKFALTEPYYSFYWGNLLDRVGYLMKNSNERLRFIGHACAIGTNEINLNLSKRRAELFHQKFLQHVKERYKDSYQQIIKRIDPPEMFGETRPFFFRGPKGQEILLGDNYKPLGRQMNRRVIALFYFQE